MKRSILYFDDEAPLLEIFREMFGNDYEVSTARTLAEARRTLDECSADIIISDQLMPEIEGTKFLAESVRYCPHSFRVLLTGRVVVGDVIAEIGAGIIHLFMRKPWTEAEMREALSRAEVFLNSSRKPRRKRQKDG